MDEGQYLTRVGLFVFKESVSVVVEPNTKLVPHLPTEDQSSAVAFMWRTALCSL